MTLAVNQNASTLLTVSNTTSGTSSEAAYLFTSNNGSGSIGKASASKTSYKTYLANDTLIYNSASGDISILNDFATGKIKFAGGGSSTAQMTLTAAGRLLLGTVLEGTFLLDVLGASRINGNVIFGVSGTNFYWDNSNARLGVRTTTPSASIDVWNNGTTEVGQYRLSDSRVTIPTYTALFNPILTSNTLGYFAPFSGSTGGIAFVGFTSNTNTGTPFALSGYHGGTSPTTAAIKFVGWKHDGASGRTALTGSEIIAGFAAGTGADVFQVKANGRINMSSLPTSPVGLSSGDLWNNLGILSIA